MASPFLNERFLDDNTFKANMCIWMSCKLICSNAEFSQVETSQMYNFMNSTHTVLQYKEVKFLDIFEKK